MFVEPLHESSNGVSCLYPEVIVMQAVVYARYLFRDVVIGWPGSVHDARVLSNSELYNQGLQGKLFDPNIKETSLGVETRESSTFPVDIFADILLLS